MKKITLSIIILLFTTTLFSQEISGVSVPIVTYKVDTTATSHGLTIPSPFYFSVSSLTAEVDTSIGMFLQSYTITSTDSNCVNKISLDSIPGVKIYPMPVNVVDTITLGGMVEKYVKQNLIDIFGENNVSKFK